MALSFSVSLPLVRELLYNIPEQLHKPLQKQEWLLCTRGLLMYVCILYGYETVCLDGWCVFSPHHHHHHLHLHLPESDLIMRDCSVLLFVPISWLHVGSEWWCLYNSCFSRWGTHSSWSTASWILTASVPPCDQYLPVYHCDLLKDPVCCSLWWWVLPCSHKILNMHLIQWVFSVWTVNPINHSY